MFTYSLVQFCQATSAQGGPAFFAYSTNYLIDLQSGIIVDVEASTVNKSAEVEATKMMIDRVEGQFAIQPDRLVADTAYGAAAMLHWLVDEKAIEPHIPVWEKSERSDGTLSRSDFQLGNANSIATCIFSFIQSLICPANQCIDAILFGVQR